MDNPATVDDMVLKVDPAFIESHSTTCVPQLFDGKLKILCVESDMKGVVKWWIEEPKMSEAGR